MSTAAVQSESIVKPSLEPASKPKRAEPSQSAAKGGGSTVDVARSRGAAGVTAEAVVGLELGGVGIQLGGSISAGAGGIAVQGGVQVTGSGGGAASGAGAAHPETAGGGAGGEAGAQQETAGGAGGGGGAPAGEPPPGAAPGDTAPIGEAPGEPSVAEPSGNPSAPGEAAEAAAESAARTAVPEADGAAPAPAPGPAALPETGPAAGGAPSPLSGGGAASLDHAGSTEDVLDAYMQSNWNDESYRNHYRTIGGIPTGLVNNPYLPRMDIDQRTDEHGEPLPPPPASASLAASWVISATANLVDAGIDIGLLMTCPQLFVIKEGAELLIAGGAYVRDAYRQYERTDDPDGPVGEIVFAANLLRGAADAASSFCQTLGNITTAASWLGIALAPFSEGLSALCGEIVAAVGEIPRVSAEVILGVRTFADFVQTVGNAYLMQYHTNHSDPHRYQAAREAFMGNADALVGDGIEIINTLISAAVVNLLPTVQMGGESMGVIEANRRARVDELSSPTGPHGHMSERGRRAMAEHQAGTEADEAASSESEPYQIGEGSTERIQSLTGLVLGAALGNPTNTHIRPATSESPIASGIINPERTATGDAMRESRELLEQEGNKPLWYQRLVDDFDEGLSASTTASGVIDEMGTPEGRLRMMLQPFLPMLNPLLDGVIDDDPAALAARIQEKCPEILTVQTTLREVATRLLEHRDDIDGVLDSVTRSIEQQTTQLAGVRAAVDSGEAFVAGLNTNVGQVRDQIDATIGAKIEELRSTEEPNFQLPNPIPAALVMSVASTIPLVGTLLGAAGAAALQIPGVEPRVRAAIESHVNGLLRQFRELRNQAVDGLQSAKTSLLNTIERAVDRLIVEARQKINEMRELLADGGELQTTLQEKKEQVLAYIATVRETIANFKPEEIDFVALVGWMQQVVRAIQIQLDATGGQDPDALRREWQTVIDGEARPHVAQWKTQFSPHVEISQNPSAPVTELAAFRRAASAVEGRISAWRTSMPHQPSSESARYDSIADQYRIILQRVRAKGAEAEARNGIFSLNKLWDAEQQLVALDRQIPQPGSDETTASHPGEHPETESESEGAA